MGDEFRSFYSQVRELFARGRVADAPARCHRPVFFHAVNPLRSPEDSDLAVAQPVTVEAMRAARATAGTLRPSLSVTLGELHYPEDAPAAPEDFVALGELSGSALDVAAFEQPRRLPLLWEILAKAAQGVDRWAEERGIASERVFLVYTNIDIAPLPHFYLLLQDIAALGYDAFAINRRTIPKIYTRADQLAFMCSELGERHPGIDCVVVWRPLLARFVPFRSIVGRGFVMRALLFNMAALAEHATILVDAHATVHIGDDRLWADSKQSDYEVFNKEQALAVWRRLAEEPRLASRLRRFARQTGEWWVPESYLGTDGAARYWWRLRRRLRLRRWRDALLRAMAPKDRP